MAEVVSCFVLPGALEFEVRVSFRSGLISRASIPPDFDPLTDGLTVSEFFGTNLFERDSDNTQSAIKAVNDWWKANTALVPQLVTTAKRLLGGAQADSLRASLEPILGEYPQVMKRLRPPFEIALYGETDQEHFLGIRNSSGLIQTPLPDDTWRVCLKALRAVDPPILFSPTKLEMLVDASGKIIRVGY